MGGHNLPPPPGWDRLTYQSNIGGAEAPPPGDSPATFSLQQQRTTQNLFASQFDDFFCAKNHEKSKGGKYLGALVYFRQI